MPHLYRAVAVTGFIAMTSPAFSADLAQSAMAGDPTWPAVERVAPSMALTQQATESSPGNEMAPPVTSGPASGMALHQAPLSEDPLQGAPLTPGGGPDKGSKQLVACQGSCACAG